MIDEVLVRKIVEQVISLMDDAKCSDGTICQKCEHCVVRNEPGTQAIIGAGADRIGSSLGALPRNKELAKFIDHTLLKPETAEEEIRKLCAEASEYEFASVCVNPHWVPLCAKLLDGTTVKICTVIGFPLGANSKEVKAFEASSALQAGANEFDMVINIGALKSLDYRAVYEDISVIVNTVHPHTVKVIIETALLTDREKIEACAIAKEAGAHFVKTSTGFAKGGATVDDIQLMKKVVGEKMEVKASGGVRDYETAIEMIKAGATRIGASAGVAIVKGEKGKGDY